MVIRPEPTAPTVPAASLHCSLNSSAVRSKTTDVIDITSPRYESLKISFRRTIRVPDNADISMLPPDMGAFPLYSIAAFKDNFPAEMASKGGLFLPMYQREAMWIRFDSPDEFAIKIFAGGVNVISGESMIETPATRLRRLNLLAQNKSIQDYIITPDQLWLDGVAMAEGRVRQFIAMPMGTGYTVEAQITGQDITGGLQFEITPAKVVLPEHSARSLTVKTLPGKNIEFSNLTSWTTIGELKKRIEDKEGIPPDQQRLIHQRIQLDRNKRSIGEYEIPDQGILHMVLKLRGGGGGPQWPQRNELGIAAGGLIKQCILKDRYPADIWQPDRTICFNVQILDSAIFRQITGFDPPDTPVSAATYAEHGLPFYDIYNENSDIKGHFEAVKSVKAIEKSEQGPHDNDQEELSYTNPIVLLNPDGVKMGFRTVSELEHELASMNAVRF